MIKDLLSKLQVRQDLTEAETSSAMSLIMSGKASPAEIAGFLIALSVKGERPDEIVGLAKVMRDAAVALNKQFEDVFDTCGTGGDGIGSFNVSSVVALVVAASGVRTAKHGNRSVSSRSGSADLFETLGVNVSGAPSVAERCLDQVGIAFFFAPTFHPSMRHAALTRRELGVRTAFNLLGPLTNPVGAARQLVGVAKPEHTDLLAQSLRRLGSDRAWIVHGAEGIDEVSITGFTKVSECREGRVNTFYLHPSDFGVPEGDLAQLKVEGPKESVSMTREVLAGKHNVARDIVLVNAAASLFVAEKVSTLKDGVRLAATVIDDGSAARLLDRFCKCSCE
tara:strand:+ start:11685 stop:12695 length:1011 start_codon:yes stop_codon:yes gene_type:complete